MNVWMEETVFAELALTEDKMMSLNCLQLVKSNDRYVPTMHHMAWPCYHRSGDATWHKNTFCLTFNRFKALFHFSY